jgi:hypothetical protein
LSFARLTERFWPLQRTRAARKQIANNPNPAIGRVDGSGMVFRSNTAAAGIPSKTNQLARRGRALRVTPWLYSQRGPTARPAPEQVCPLLVWMWTDSFAGINGKIRTRLSMRAGVWPAPGFLSIAIADRQQSESLLKAQLAVLCGFQLCAECVSHSVQFHSMELGRQGAPFR